jgi:hypothetical protein
MERRKRIRFLKGTFGNDVGDEVLAQVTDKEIDYTDGWGRWCFMDRKDEGEWFEFVKRKGKKDERS